ncbi:protein phosphatase 2C domain-containing protein [Streptomyces sp. NPDC021562]|uniref:protein phosphatase 2C domain-containing protein n=1 Tax=Streptomyces sp. NPDC021562 TaxID=3155121 RepID=UPI001050A66F
MLKVLDSLSVPGDSMRLNEDRYGYSGELAWVIDGATDLESDSFLPAPSDVQWLVDRVGELLREAAAEDGYPGARDFLTGLSRRVAQDIRSLSFPDSRIHPTCSIGLLHVGPEGAELARVGDPTCIAYGDEVTELSTGFFGRREAEAIERAQGADLSDSNSREGILRRRQKYIKGVFDESVFSGHPEAVLRIQSERVAPGRAKHVLLCTDGFARAVVDYGIFENWSALLQEALASGLASVRDRIRRYEEQARHTAHFKRSDDVTALLLAL